MQNVSSLTETGFPGKKKTFLGFTLHDGRDYRRSGRTRSVAQRWRAFSCGHSYRPELYQCIEVVEGVEWHLRCLLSQ